ncbi:MAG: nucleotidyltransferase family protein [Prevotellaceae bacterium]|jgi:predicted nucleotidyltransferase|nr:nucleotidyltransferase family protein [Prevotellaceae bacterium]
MKTGNEVIRKLEELKPFLQQSYAVSKIGLFGSFANGVPTERSDIDILVEFEKPIGWRFFSLEMYLEKIFKRKVDLVTRVALKEQIASSILTQMRYI